MQLARSSASGAPAARLRAPDHHAIQYMFAFSFSSHYNYNSNSNAPHKSHKTKTITPNIQHTTNSF